MGRRGPQPDYAKREQLAKLIGEGVTLSEAARLVGVNRRTAKRWRNGRAITYASGQVLKLAPVISTAAPKEYSPRYLSEDERIRLADLRREKHTIRDIGRDLAVGIDEKDPGGHTTQVMGLDSADTSPVFWDADTSPAEFADDIQTLLED